MPDGNDYVSRPALRVSQSAEAGDFFPCSLFMGVYSFKETVLGIDRRLSLIDTSKCSPELKIRVDLDRQLMSPPTGLHRNRLLSR